MDLYCISFDSCIGFHSWETRCILYCGSITNRTPYQVKDLKLTYSNEVIDIFGEVHESYVKLAKRSETDVKLSEFNCASDRPNTS